MKAKATFMTELAKHEEAMGNAKNEMAEAMYSRNELALEYDRKLSALETMVIETGYKIEYHDSMIVDFGKKIEDADTTKSIIEYALRATVEKPFAVWSIGQVAEFMELESRSRVEALGQRQCIHALNKLLHMGYEENPAAVVDVIRAGCDLVPELHNRICFLLQLDERDVSEDVPVDLAARVLQLEQENEQLKKRARHDY